MNTTKYLVQEIDSLVTLRKEVNTQIQAIINKLATSPNSKVLNYEFQDLKNKKDELSKELRDTRVLVVSLLLEEFGAKLIQVGKDLFTVADKDVAPTPIARRTPQEWVKIASC